MNSFSQSAPPVSLDPQPMQPPPRVAGGVAAAPIPVLTSDRASTGAEGLEGAANLSRAPAVLEQAAELLAHAGAQTPFAIGLFGGAGAGKSQAAGGMLKGAARLSAAAGKLNGASPFLQRIAFARFSAAEAGANAPGALAACVNEALCAGAAGQDFSAFALAAAHAATDPHVAAREANQRHDDIRRQLEGERRALDEAGSRRARLADVLLYETPGSRIDAQARANRGRIEASLARFGFKGDPIANYKALVRDVAESRGGGGRISLFFRALWAFGGQAQLIVWAILFFVLAWVCALGGQTSGTWAPWLAGISEQMRAPADWLAAHVSWLDLLRQGALAAAALCLLTNLWRAARFVGPLMRGANLLDSDIQARRRDLDSQIAHQTRRVDVLAADSEAHARHAADAEKRALAGSGRAGPAAGSRTAHSLFGDAAGGEGAQRVQAFFDALEQGMADSKNTSAPQRIVVLMDDLDALAGADAAQVLEAAHRLLSRRGFAIVVCADAERLARAWGGGAQAAQKLCRLVQIPLSLTSPGGGAALRDYALQLLGAAPPVEASAMPDAARSTLDAPLEAGEAGVIALLAPLAGDTPRAVKRFVNIYRFARARGGDIKALALMLAVDAGRKAGETAAMQAAMNGAADRPLAIAADEARLAAALASVNEARGALMTIAEAKAAWAVSRDYRTPF